MIKDLQEEWIAEHPLAGQPAGEGASLPSLPIGNRDLDRSTMKVRSLRLDDRFK